MDFKQAVRAARIVHGNENQIKNVMRRAAAGDELCIGFLGGSITQGSLAAHQDRCYASLVWQWWIQTFPQSSFSIVNAGIGGTTSLFGAARAGEDLLRAHPDFVIIDFTVNDDNIPFSGETFEGVIRQVCRSAAVMILCNVYYDSGKNAEDAHIPVARHYQIPTVSMKASILRMMQTGGLAEDTFTPDHLHPNDCGHRMAADIIIHQLRNIYQTMEMRETGRKDPVRMPLPLTKNRFECARRLQSPDCQPVLDGFRADDREKCGILDIWKRGWYAANAGDSITFEVYASCISVQFLRSVRRKSPVAEAVVDGDQSNTVRLDGNFDEDWGDFLALYTVLDTEKSMVHKVQIRIIEPGEEPFYLVSVITDGDNAIKTQEDQT